MADTVQSTHEGIAGRSWKQKAPYGEQQFSPWIFRFFAAIALAIMLVPAAVVVLVGLNEAEYITFPPQGLSLKWVVFRELRLLFYQYQGQQGVVCASNTVYVPLLELDFLAPRIRY